MKVGGGGGVGLRRDRAAAPVRRPPRVRGGGGDRRHPRRASRWRPTPRRWPAPTPPSSTPRPTPTPSTGWTSSSAPCPTGSPSAWCPGWWTGWGRWSTWRRTSGCSDPAALPAWYGEEHAAPELLASLRLRPARAVRRRPGRGPAGGGAGVLPDGGRPGPGTPGAGRGASSRRGSWSTRPAGCRGPAGRPASGCTSGRSTRTSRAYGLLTHRHTPEIEQALGALGALHPPPGPDGPGHPGHLLCPAARASSTTAGAHRRPARPPTPTRRSWRSPTSRRPPRTPPGRTAPT